MKTQINLTGNQLSNFSYYVWLAYFSIIVSVILSGSYTVKAQSNPFTKITDDQMPQYNPAIDGDYVVYQDRRNGGVDDIYLYNIATGEEINLTSNKNIQSVNPDISGDRIVWQEYRNGSWDIYYYNISRPDLGAYPMIDFPGNQENPRIYKNLLVWEDDQGGNSYDIFMYDLSTGDLTQITDEDFNQYHPDIYGNYIVYQDNRNGNEDIYMYDILNKKEIRLTDDPADQQNPSIYGSRVVWEDNRDGNWNLYMHYINYWPGTVYENYDWPIYTACNPDKPFFQSSYDEKNPRIWGDSIIFQDDRNGNWDLYLYSFFSKIYGKTTPLVSEDKNQINPAISNNRIVWQDERDWNGNSDYEADIWLWEHPPRPPGADLGVAIFDTPDPVAVGDELTYKIFVKNSGPQDATNVVLTTTISGNVEFLSISSANGGNCSRSGNTITCNIGDLANGGTETITVVVRAATEGTINTSAAITATEDDQVSSNNSSSVKTTVKWKLSKIIGTGSHPLIAIDANGKIHICSMSSVWGNLLYTTNKTGNWVSENIITANQMTSYAMATDNNGNVHIAYGVQGEIGKLMYITNVSGTWSTPETIETDAGQCGSVCIKTDSKNNIHISYMDAMWGNGSLHYLKNTTGSWSSEIIEPEGSYLSSSFDLDSNDNAHFSYYKTSIGFGATSQGGITYRTNSPDSIWHAALPVENNYKCGQCESLITDIAVDHDLNPHISYVGAKPEGGNEDTKYAYLIDGQWHDTIIDNGEFSGSFSAIATDLNNKAHIVYYHSLSREIRYATNTEGSWVKHMLDTDGDEQCDICTDDLGYVHIVYSKSDGLYSKLYYVTNKPPTPEPEIIVIPSSIDFVIRAVGDTTEAEKVIIKNNGNANLQISDISIVWNDSIHFTITNNTCSNLAPSDTCSVDVVFNPQTFGDKKALLWIESNDPVNPTEGVILEGKGMAPKVWDYGSLAFEDVTVGDSSTHVYTIKNKGNTNLQVQLITITEDDASDFHYTDLPDTPFNIGKNDSIMFNIVFKPGSAGDKTTILRIFTNDLDLTRILTGTGIPPTFSVEGKVMVNEDTPVNEGRIYVYEPDEDSNQTYLWHKPLAGTNAFTINAIPKGNVTLRCDPDTSIYPGFLNTYLGNTPDYSDAEFFYLDQDTSSLEITLVPVPPAPGGTSNISGIFVEESGKSGSTLNYEKYDGNGTPVKNVSVFLVNPDGSLLTFDATDSTGVFDFNNIPPGHYKFVADYVGFFMDDTNDSLIISQENQKYTLAAIANNNLITIEVENVTGKENLMSDNEITVYPNPVKDNLYLKFDKALEWDVRIRIIGIDGSILKTLQPGPVQGKAVLDISLSDLPPGLYILSVEGNKISYKARIVKQ